MRIREKEIRRRRKRSAEQLHEKIKSLSTAKPQARTSRPASRPAAKPASSGKPAAPRPPRPKPAAPTE